MANWQRTLRLQPEWDAAKDGDISVAELAGVVAKRLKELRPFGDEYIDGMRDQLVEEFEDLSRDVNTDTDRFDYLLNELYDWGDLSLDGKFNGKKVCFINWISRSKTEMVTPPLSVVALGLVLSLVTWVAV